LESRRTCDGQGIPEGYTSVTPYLLIKDVRGQIDFVTRAFGATVNLKMDMPDGAIAHADVSVFGSHVMMGYGGAAHGAKPAMLYLYVGRRRRRSQAGRRRGREGAGAGDEPVLRRPRRQRAGRQRQHLVDRDARAGSVWRRVETAHGGRTAEVEE